MKRTATLAAVAALALTAYTGAAQAGITCQTDAAAEIAAATVNGPRAGWDPPVWTFFMPDLNTGVDVQAYTRNDAASKAQDWLSGQVSSACAAEAPAPQAPGNNAPSGNGRSSSAPTYDAPTTSAAQALADSANVKYVGNSWGPVPLYEVFVPSLNMGIDVAANSEAEARSAVVPTIAAAIGGVPVDASAPQTNVLPTSSTSLVTSESNPVQSLITATVLFPERSLGYLIRAGYGVDGALTAAGVTTTG